MRAFTLLSLGQAVVAATLLAFSGPVASDPPAPAIEIREAWIRWLPANLPNAGYFTLINQGSTTVTLIGVHSPQYADASIHRSSQRNGMSEMSAVDSITIQPHTTLRLADGGYHLMLMQPKRALNPGERVAVTLSFASGAAITAQFEVRAADGS